MIVNRRIAVPIPSISMAEAHVVVEPLKWTTPKP
jgi:hypothetical protein